MYDEIVKRLHKRISLTTAGSPLQDDLWEAADAIEQLIEERDAYRKAMTDEHNRAARLLWDKEHCWISVEERLPEKNGTYLVYVYGEVTEMNCWHGKWHRLGDDYTKAVTHWMPLPEPPKEES